METASWFCLSKGLCAPVGSVVCATEDFIARARKNRKMVGGGMRQCGILAAAGMIAIEKMSKRVGEDHENARYFAQKLAALPDVTVDMDAVQISMVFFTIDRPGFDHQNFPAAMREKGILINGIEDGKYRFVTHYWVGKKEIDQVVVRWRSCLHKECLPVRDRVYKPAVRPVWKVAFFDDFLGWALLFDDFRIL